MMETLRTILGVFCLLLASGTAGAQVPQPSSGPPQNQSLAAALAAAAVPQDRIFLTVSPEKISLPQDGVMPPEKSSLTTVTDTYQRSVRAFGSVTAIAPPTMFVLNAHLDTANIYAQIQPDEALRLLGASLSDSQWKALISENGLGLSDLTDDNQRNLFHAIVPDGSLDIVGPPQMYSITSQDLSSQVSQTRLRITEDIQLAIQMKSIPNAFTNTYSDDPPPYLWNRVFVRNDALQGLSPSASVPNVLKNGQLDWNLPALHEPVPLSGLKTVGDLIDRIAQVTGLELYADPRYEKKSITILGNSEYSAPASDILRALAFCLTGAFRQVGPAYVLTDDVLGLETRRQYLDRAGKEAQRHVKELLNKAADVLGTKHYMSELQGLDDPLVLSDAERAKFPPSGDENASYQLINLSKDQLTKAQQENIRQQEAKASQDTSSGGNNQLDLNGKIQIQIKPQLQLLIPSLDHPVTTVVQIVTFFQISPQLYRQRLKKKDTAQVSELPKATLSKAMLLTSHRALLVHIDSPADLTTILTQMLHLGFNQLWLDVFSQGHMQTRMPDGSDLLTRAIRLAHAKGIQVYAVLNLFQWGDDAPKNAVDLDPFGNTSQQAETVFVQNAQAEVEVTGFPQQISPPKTGLSVTPLDKAVSERLLGAVSQIAQHSGLAGIILRETAPGGYDNQRDLTFITEHPDLGYTMENRLAFLRQVHADPLDISKARGMGPQGGGGRGGNGVMVSETTAISNATGTDIPSFDDPQSDAELSIAWDKVRLDADLSLMQAIYEAAKTRNPDLAMIVQQRHSDFSKNWYGLWDNQTSPLPEWTPLTIGDNGSFGPDQIAKHQTLLAFAGLEAKDASTLSGLPAALEDDLKDSVWDGFVWDLSSSKPSALSALEQSTKK